MMYAVHIHRVVDVMVMSSNAAKGFAKPMHVYKSWIMHAVHIHKMIGVMVMNR